VVGNGSNLLVSDEGYHGVIISTERFRKLEISGCRVNAGAGVLLSRLANAACGESLSGLEFSAGIPGTVGGAVVMNAGAYGSEIKDVLESVCILDEEGQVRTLSGADLKLGYRTSILMEKPWIVLEAAFALTPGEEGTIRSRMEELAAQRKEKQPLEYPSAGSTFKRPEGHFAGKLIEAAGLKGFSVGGAAVSEKHAGFVINRDSATAADIYRLCREIRERVRENSGVTLELEVKLLGDFH
jgi:UDP-N-acetylmuramate dehydrogenase